MIRIAALKKANAEAATHCSNQRSNRAMVQSKEKSDLTVKTSLATNMALEIKEMFSEQTHHHHHPETVPSNNPSKANSSVPQLSANLAKLASDLDHLTHRVQKLDKKKAHRSHAVFTSTTRSGTSGRASRKSRVSNVTMSSADRRDTVAHGFKREKRDLSPHESSSDPYLQSWETPRNRGQPETQHKYHSDRDPLPLFDYQETYITLDEIPSWNESIFSNHERPSARYCGRIQQVSVALKEHNKQFRSYTTEWKQYRTEILRVWNTTSLNVWLHHKSWHTRISPPTFKPHPTLN